MLLKKAAEAGHLEAQLHMARSNAKGELKNSKEAAHWYGEAAKQKCPEAQYKLACSYFKGLGVEKDPKAAFYWCEQAANQGHIEAQLSLAACYIDRWGTDKNEKQAIFWYNKAAEKGNTRAIQAIGDLLKNQPSLYENLCSLLRNSAAQSSVTGRGSKRKTLEDKTNENEKSDNPPSPKENRTSNPSITETARHRFSTGQASTASSSSSSSSSSLNNYISPFTRAAWQIPNR